MIAVRDPLVGIAAHVVRADGRAVALERSHGGEDAAIRLDDPEVVCDTALVLVAPRVRGWI
jgi:hypothetical protein